jgi:hypothetical protein
MLHGVVLRVADVAL